MSDVEQVESSTATVSLPIEDFSDAQRAEWLSSGKIPEKQPVAGESATPEGKPPAQEPVVEPKKQEQTQPQPAAQPQPLTGDEVSRRVREALSEAREKPAPKEESKADPRPKLSDAKYQADDGWDRYQDDLDAWYDRRTEIRAREIAGKLIDEREQVSAQRTATQKATEQFTSREAKARERNPEYDRLKDGFLSKWLTAQEPGLETAGEFIRDSDIGPDLLAHYAANEQKWRELITLPSASRIIREMTLVEAELQRGFTAPANVNGAQQSRNTDGTFAPKAKTVSSASPPPESLGGRQGPPGDPVEAAIAAGDFEAYQLAMNAKEAHGQKR